MNKRRSRLNTEAEHSGGESLNPPLWKSKLMGGPTKLNVVIVRGDWFIELRPKHMPSSRLVRAHPAEASWIHSLRCAIRTGGMKETWWLESCQRQQGFQAAGDSFQRMRAYKAELWRILDTPEGVERRRGARFWLASQPRHTSKKKPPRPLKP